MEIQFVVEPDDVWQYYKRVSLRRQVKRTTLWILLVVSVLFLYDFFYCHLTAFWAAVYCLPVLVIGLLFQWVMKKPAVMMQARATPGVLGPVAVVIGPDAVSRKSAVSETITPWRSYVKINADDALMYFFLTPASAQIIPTRAFADPREAQRFLDAALSFWGGQPVTPGFTAEEATWPPPPTSGSRRRGS